MPAASAAPPEEINAFPVADAVLFKHYFEGADVFDRLKPYYDGTQYRFEVPADEFESVRRFLRDHGYHLSVVDHQIEYYVVVRQYSDHPENIFKGSVRQESVDGYNCFLMKDRAAVETAVAQGATELADTSLSLPGASLGDYAES